MLAFLVISFSFIVLNTSICSWFPSLCLNPRPLLWTWGSYLLAYLTSLIGCLRDISNLTFAQQTTHLQKPVPQPHKWPLILLVTQAKMLESSIFSHTHIQSCLTTFKIHAEPGHFSPFPLLIAWSNPLLSLPRPVQFSLFQFLLLYSVFTKSNQSNSFKVWVGAYHPSV